MIDDYCAGRLGIVTRPRAGDWLEGEIGALQSIGVDVLAHS